MRRGLFRWSAVGALVLHALLLFPRGDGLRAGADLVPHLRLMQVTHDAPRLYNVYAPAYHALGALLSPWLGAEGYVRLFALASALALIAGFRFFQRRAGLPDVSAALFAWTPYLFALSHCLPKVEALGYAMAFTGLGLQLRRQRAALAVALAATFWVHTAAALFLGLCGGVLALAQRDRRALAALAAGSAAAAPLIAAHLAAGCSLAQALLFSHGDYLRIGGAGFGRLDRVLLLAGPISLVAAALGAPTLWRAHRPLAVVAATVVLLYLNAFWLAPFRMGTTLTPMRGLTILAFPLAAGAGVFAAARPRLQTALVAACAAWALAAAAWFVPDACHVRPIDLAAIESVQVRRCAFRWTLPPGQRAPARPRSERSDRI